MIDKYMEVIIKSLGGVDGIMMDPNAPVPQANEVLLATFSGQFNQLGLIVLVISFMGMIASEKNSGVQGFIFTRPVSNMQYIVSKLLGNWFISMVCISVGSIVSYCYSIYLFDYYPLINFLLFLVFYSLWILFVISIAVLLSTFISSSIFIGVTTIMVAMVFMLLGGINETLALFLPSGALILAESQLQNTHSNFLLMIAPIIYIVISLYAAKVIIKKI
ncbi:ABC transporter permease [Paraliobacillus sp. JSM ZJ581]|uniref:ABC transporter permease n=1 Tax=Paraliobacillus sp. JSM ZJ581 TaxID=3342118 RepID=UPI0035A93815